MFKSRRFVCALMVFCLSASSCVTEVHKKELSLVQQIEVDTKSAEGLTRDFKQQVKFIANPEAEDFMEAMVVKLLKRRDGFQNGSVEIKIHDDTDPKYRRFFAFPGITISVPYSFLRRIGFENELAAGLAFELATVFDRELAKKVEKEKALAKAPELFSKNSVFNLTKSERIAAIRLGTTLLEESGYDNRGMSSIFSRYPVYYVQETSSELFQKQVVLSIREAQRAQSEYLPQMKPTVRSSEFIQFKKQLLKKTRASKGQ